MQDRYTGDIGDFGKYALLNALTGPDLRLGVAWYLYPDAEVNRDGGFVAYPELRHCDPALHDKLGGIVAAGNRCVAAIEAGYILPASTVFCSSPLTFRDLPTFATAERRTRRTAWIERVPVCHGTGRHCLHGPGRRLRGPLGLRYGEHGSEVRFPG